MLRSVSSYPDLPTTAPATPRGGVVPTAGSLFGTAHSAVSSHSDLPPLPPTAPATPRGGVVPTPGSLFGTAHSAEGLFATAAAPTGRNEQERIVLIHQARTLGHEIENLLCSHYNFGLGSMQKSDKTSTMETDHLTRNRNDLETFRLQLSTLLKNLKKFNFPDSSEKEQRLDAELRDLAYQVRNRIENIDYVLHLRRKR